MSCNSICILYPSFSWSSSRSPSLLSILHALSTALLFLSIVDRYRNHPSPSCKPSVEANRPIQISSLLILLSHVTPLNVRNIFISLVSSICSFFFCSFHTSAQFIRAFPVINLNVVSVKFLAFSCRKFYNLSSETSQCFTDFRLWFCSWHNLFKLSFTNTMFLRCLSTSKCSRIYRKKRRCKNWKERSELQKMRPKPKSLMMMLLVYHLVLLFSVSMSLFFRKISNLCDAV